MVNENSYSNEALLMGSGTVSIKRTSNDAHHLAQWYKQIDPSFRDDFEIIELIQRAIRLFSSIPKGKEIIICFQEDGELLGLELIFSSYKAGFFTVEAMSHSLEYYSIDRQIERAVSSYRLKEILFTSFKHQLKHRLDYLAKKLAILNINKQKEVKSRVEKLAGNTRIIRHLRDDEDLIIPPPVDLQTKESFNKRFPYVNNDKDIEAIQLYKIKRPEADQDIEPNFDTSALNGRVSIWSKIDLFKFYMKEAKVNPEMSSFYGFASKNKRSTPKLKPLSQDQESQDSKMTSSASLPFFVKRFAKTKQKKKETQKGNISLT